MNWGFTGAINIKAFRIVFTYHDHRKLLYYKLFQEFPRVIYTL